MAVIWAAFISVVGLLLVEVARRRASTVRSAARNVEELVESQEEFIRTAIESVAALHAASAATPRLPFAPAPRALREALRSAVERRTELLKSHARVRRDANDQVVVAADAVLDVVARAADLTSGRGRWDPWRWDAVWSTMRECRIAFERVARTDPPPERRRRPFGFGLVTARRMGTVA